METTFFFKISKTENTSRTISDKNEPDEESGPSRLDTLILKDFKTDYPYGQALLRTGYIADETFFPISKIV